MQRLKCWLEIKIEISKINLAFTKITEHGSWLVEASHVTDKVTESKEKKEVLSMQL